MKIGIVIPWFGRDLKGGAEQQAWQIAARLAARGHDVEALTTCCRSHQDDWETNHLPPSTSKEPEGFSIRRFRVDPRDRVAFERVCSELLSLEKAALKPGISPVSQEASTIFARELIKSQELLAFLAAHRNDYDWFLFLPYLYGPILDGIEIAASRAILQPCLHDEPYAYLPEVRAAFYRARQLFFNSEGERELALRLFGPGITEKSRVVGEGVESAEGAGDNAPAGNNSAPAGDGQYILYLGRKGPGKNTDMLVRAFSRFRRVRPNSRLRLVLAGHGRVNPNEATHWIEDRGLVSEGEKQALLNGCTALAQPSVNESFSRVMMEAWRHGKPVAVNKECLATATEVARAKGGWRIGSEDEWAAWFVEVDRTGPQTLRVLGNNGRQHARRVADWDGVLDRYEEALSRFDPAVKAVPPARGAPPIINQFLPNLSPGDAISNEALFVRDQLRALGFRSDIYVRTIHPLLPPNRCHLFSSAALENSDAIIYHHSIGTDITRPVIEYEGPKCLIYHNITPAEFVEPFRPRFAELLRQGRKDLPGLAPAFDISYGDSQFNADELKGAGFPNPQVLPICVNPAKWSFAPDNSLMTSLADGRTNIIFVGRIASNKKQDDLVRAFAHYLVLDPDARLFLVGTVEGADPYAEYLFSLIEHLGLKKSIRVTNNISDAELAAYYRTARLFWSMSEHEGFCVPLIEAMWFDVPVFAFRSSAVPETLGDAAIMFNDKSDSKTLAALARVLVTDEELRGQVIAAQRRQRRAFLPSQITPVIAELADRLLRQVSLHSLPAD